MYVKDKKKYTHSRKKREEKKQRIKCREDKEKKSRFTRQNGDKMRECVRIYKRKDNEK